MGLFARIFEDPSPEIPMQHDSDPGKLTYIEKLPSHFVVGNVHKVAETASNREFLWNYYGFGPPNSTATSLYEGMGIDKALSQQGVIVQGDFGPQFCALGGLSKMNNHKVHKTFRAQCLPNQRFKIAPLSGDFFCSNMHAARGVQVTPPCDWSNDTNPITMSDHAVVSVVVRSNKK